MANILGSFLRPLGMDPSQGYDTAAAGARAAQSQANDLSALQWQRQMGGLQGALGYVGGLQQLYNSIYGAGGGAAAPGGSVVPPPPGAAASAMSTLAKPVPGSGGGNPQSQSAAAFKAKAGVTGSGGWRGQ